MPRSLRQLLIGIATRAAPAHATPRRSKTGASAPPVCLCGSDAENSAGTGIVGLDPADSCKAVPAVASEDITPRFPRRHRTPAGEDRPGTVVPDVIVRSSGAETLTPQQNSSGFPVEPITCAARNSWPRNGAFSPAFT